jgi:hypothetical protein
MINFLIGMSVGTMWGLILAALLRANDLDGGEK